MKRKQMARGVFHCLIIPLIVSCQNDSVTIGSMDSETLSLNESNTFSAVVSSSEVSDTPVISQAFENSDENASINDGGSFNGVLGSEEFALSDLLPAYRALTGKVEFDTVQNVTVCIDENQNEACDAEEPFTRTDKTGVFDLNVPSGSEDRPLVAIVQGAALNEAADPLLTSDIKLFSAPGMPEVITPITTMIYQLMLDNPTYTVDDAEQILRVHLGTAITDDAIPAGSNLAFQEYDAVAHEDDQSAFIEHTNFIISQLLGHVKNQIELTVSAEGFDSVGDSATNSAIDRLARVEVLRVVSSTAFRNAHTKYANTLDYDGEIAIVDTQSLLERDQIISDLLATVKIENISSRLTASLSITIYDDSDLYQILSNGIYRVSSVCLPRSDTLLNSEIVTSMDGQNSTVESKITSEECTDSYNRIQLSLSGEEIVSRQFQYDIATAQWLSNDYEVKESDYYLVEGQWVALESSEIDGRVEFLDQNSAIVSNDNGRLYIKSATTVLDGKNVSSHLSSRTDNEELRVANSEEHQFNTGSQAYRISVRETNHPYILFYQQSPRESVNSCDLYNGNCNVVNIGYETLAESALSFADIYDRILSGESVHLRTAQGDNTNITLVGGYSSEGVLQGQVQFDPIGAELYGSMLIGTSDVLNSDTATLPTESVSTTSELADGFALDAADDGGSDTAVSVPELSEIYSDDLNNLEQCIAEVIIQRTNSDNTAALLSDPFSPVDFVGSGEELAGLDNAGELFGELDQLPVDELNRPASTADILDPNTQFIDFFAPGDFAGTREELSALANAGSTIDPTEGTEGGDTGSTSEDIGFATREEALSESAGTHSQPITEYLDLFAPGDFSGTREELADLVQENEQYQYDHIALLEGLKGDELLSALDAGSFDHNCIVPVPNDSAIQIIDNLNPSRNISDDSGMGNELLSNSSYLSTWKVIEVQGVEMIEITLPQESSNVLGENSSAVLLLIEHEGFVRAGTRLPDDQIYGEFLYNEDAFITIKSLLERRGELSQKTLLNTD